MRNFFSGGLKDNSHLAYGFPTVILRVAKERYARRHKPCLSAASHWVRNDRAAEQILPLFKRRKLRSGRSIGTEFLFALGGSFRGFEVVDGADALDDVGGGADLGDDPVQGLVGHFDHSGAPLS